VIGIRTSKYKYFRDRYNPKKRNFLFNLEKDPFENNNLANNSKVIEEMENILLQITNNYKFLDDGQTIKNTDNEDTEKIENILKKLGYV